MLRAMEADGQIITRRHAATVNKRAAVDSSADEPKRVRLSHTEPMLPECRFDDTISHVPVLTTKQSGCFMCRFRRAVKKIVYPDKPDSELPKIVRPRRKCLGCDVNLCRVCFGPFHTVEQPDWDRMCLNDSRTPRS